MKSRGHADAIRARIGFTAGRGGSALPQALIEIVEPSSARSKKRSTALAGAAAKLRAEGEPGSRVSR